MINEYLRYLHESSIVNKELVKYIQKNILTKYKKFDGAHNMPHVQSVIDFSMRLQKLIKDTNPDMVYTIAAYHDIGLQGSRELHHMLSGKIVKADKKLLKWFDKQDIDIIASACEQHRASDTNYPQTIYAKIVGDADRADSVIIENLIRRTWNYRMADKQSKSQSDEEIFNEMYSHMIRKYGQGGYAKFYLPESIRLLKRSMNRTQRMIKSKDQTYKLFLKMRNSNQLKR